MYIHGIMLQSLKSWVPCQQTGYILLGKPSSLPSSHRVAIYLKVAAIATILLLITFLLRPLTAAQQYALHHSNQPIPGIVHYVYIKAKPDSQIHFPFAYFLTVYASVMYIKPSKIYIHSDYTAAEIAEAGAKGSIWTRKLINTFPGIVKWNHVRVPEFAG